MKFNNKAIKLKTKKTFDFINITAKVEDFVQETEVKNGFVNVQTLHTTTAIVVNEDEPLLKKDLERHLESFAPQKCDYHHDDFEVRTVNMCGDECANGHSHCKAIIMPTSVVLNIIGGKLQLGQWQQIFLLELDKSRNRTVQLQLLGQ